MSRGIKGPEVCFRGLPHLLVGIVENVDVVGTSLPVSVEYQPAGEITCFRAGSSNETQDIALQADETHVSSPSRSPIQASRGPRQRPERSRDRSWRARAPWHADHALGFKDIEMAHPSCENFKKDS